MAEPVFEHEDLDSSDDSGDDAASRVDQDRPKGKRSKIPIGFHGNMITTDYSRTWEWENFSCFMAPKRKYTVKNGENLNRSKGDAHADRVKEGKKRIPQTVRNRESGGFSKRILAQAAVYAMLHAGCSEHSGSPIAVLPVQEVDSRIRGHAGEKWEAFTMFEVKDSLQMARGVLQVWERYSGGTQEAIEYTSRMMHICEVQTVMGKMDPSKKRDWKNFTDLLTNADILPEHNFLGCSSLDKRRRVSRGSRWLMCGRWVIGNCIQNSNNRILTFRDWGRTLITALTDMTPVEVECTAHSPFHPSIAPRVDTILREAGIVQ